MPRKTKAQEAAERDPFAETQRLARQAVFEQKLGSTNPVDLELDEMDRRNKPDFEEETRGLLQVTCKMSTLNALAWFATGHNLKRGRALDLLLAGLVRRYREETQREAEISRASRDSLRDGRD